MEYFFNILPPSPFLTNPPKHKHSTPRRMVYKDVVSGIKKPALASCADIRPWDKPSEQRIQRSVCQSVCCCLLGCIIGLTLLGQSILPPEHGCYVVHAIGLPCGEHFVVTPDKHLLQIRREWRELVMSAVVPLSLFDHHNEVYYFEDA